VPDDDLRPRYGKRTWRRRKRSVIGKEWQPPTLQDVHAGVWCKECHVRHPYNGKGRLASAYEVRSGRNVLLWICPKTNNVVGELWLGSSPPVGGP
jgi:hypothetical protein